MIDLIHYALYLTTYYLHADTKYPEYPLYPSRWLDPPHGNCCQCYLLLIILVSTTTTIQHLLQSTGLPVLRQELSHFPLNWKIVPEKAI